MNQVVAFLEVEKQAEKARKRCMWVSRKKFGKELRRWIKLELEAAKYGRNATPTIKAKKLKRFTRKRLVEIACDLRMIRQGRVWVH